MKDRNCIDKKYTWNLSEIYSAEGFEKDFAEVKSSLGAAAAFRGKISAQNAIDALKLKSKLSEKIERLYLYAHLNKDLNAADSTYVALSERVDMLAVEASAAFSFLLPELNKLSTATLGAMAADAKYADFDIELRDIIRGKKHILTAKEEQLLSNIGLFSGDFKTIFGAFDYADIKFDDVEADGKTVQMSHATYSMLLQSRDQKVRHDAFCSNYKAYREHINTLTAIYNGNVKKNVVSARLRKYKSTLDMKMFNENVPSDIYKKLIKTVKNNLKHVHKYVELRKKVLKLPELHMYDMYVPITAEFKLSIGYDEAYSLMKKALVPLGKDYARLLDTAYENRWMDVYETKGKRSGAYSWGVHSVHPHVLLNYEETAHDVFTVAHEMGHAAHSFYSNKTQCYEKAGYEIFVAEVASTVNEVLLLKHLIDTNKDKAAKKFFLSYYLDMFRTTLFRQTMFAEFEAFAHAEVEADKPLTADKLCAKYYELNKAYYGKAVKHDEEIKYEWSRIPHFYTAFYVYKYATGLISSVNIARKILAEGDEYVKRYMGFLSSGCSKPPADLLKDIGIDLTTDLPYKEAMSEFANTLEILSREC